MRCLLSDSVLAILEMLVLIFGKPFVEFYSSVINENIFFIIKKENELVKRIHISGDG